MSKEEDKVVKLGSKNQLREMHDNIGKFCPACITVFAGQKVSMGFKFCPQCAGRVHDVKVVS